MHNITIETERLLLRPLAVTDAKITCPVEEVYTANLQG